MDQINVSEQLQKLHKDLRNAAVTLTADEARFLVDSYYIMQEDRKRSNNQVDALEKENEPHEIVGWLAANSRVLENEIKKVLDIYAASRPIGRWMQSLVGIGPVISAGMMAHIDISKCRTAGNLYSFAGYNPDKKWLPKTKRPWNADLKTLCWKAGQSFMKFSGDSDCFYGALYQQRKAYEVARNDSGGNAEAAAKILTEKNFDKKTEAYKHYSNGKLPPAHLDARARRWAVKIFLSHLQMVWWYDENGELPPVPYAIGIKGHVDFIPPPNVEEFFPNLPEALRNWK